MTTTLVSDDSSSKSSTATIIAVLGFGMAVATWVAAFITHIPAFNLPPGLAGPVVLGCWAIAAVVAGTFIPREQGGIGRVVGIGAGAGLLSALLGLLILGSQIAKPPTVDKLPAPGLEGLSPGAAGAVLGFLGAGLVIGGVGAAVGAALRGARSSRADWVFRMTLVCAASVIPLVVTGGAVTSTNSGLAIRGWPDSYGANMFLYPIALMSHPAMFIEHTHRLFGTLCGLTTLTTMVLVLRSGDGRAWVKKWAIGLFVLVCIQGILGGLRVRLGLEVSSRQGQLFALFHGVLAQVFFAGVVALSAFVSPTYRAITAGPSDAPLRKFKGMATGALHALWVQLILGALYRHFHYPHALWSHVAFSLIIVGLVTGAGFAAGAVARALSGGLAPAKVTVSRIGVGMLAVVIFQFVLGMAALGAVLSSEAKDVMPQAPENLDTVAQVPWWEAAITTAHQANGALVLAMATLGCVWSRRLWKATTH